MSTPNPILVAAAPSLITALQAIQQFNTDMGTNPAQWAANYPGASLKLIGTLQLQLPALATAEASALQTDINTKIGSAITALQALAPKTAS